MVSVMVHDMRASGSLVSCWFLEQHAALRPSNKQLSSFAVAVCAQPFSGPAWPLLLCVVHCRGFITLSTSLGQMLVALHRALLHSIQHEPDPLVLASTLRALGTLLLGAPYHRLPPQLLPLCVRALLGCLARATPAGGAASPPAEQLPVASACMACLAAAFTCKASVPALVEQILDSGGTPAPGTALPTPAAGTSIEQQQQPGTAPTQSQQLLHLLFSYASCQHAALQLEALMALRGVAQRHAALLSSCWQQLLALGRAGAALPVTAVPQSPRAQQGGRTGRLAGRLAAASPHCQFVGQQRVCMDWKQHAYCCLQLSCLLLSCRLLKHTSLPV